MLLLRFLRTAIAARLSRELLNANRRAVDLANQLYSQGLTDFLSVLQSQRDLYESEDELTQSDQNVTSDFVALYKALGGGWEIEADAHTWSSARKAGGTHG